MTAVGAAAVKRPGRPAKPQQVENDRAAAAIAA
jgi:hypothetical protein